jgi:hypothetical protein
MATTNYTLTDITSVVFDGTSLTQVNLDGVSVWPYRKPITITISSDTSNYTLQPSAITGYMAGFTDITFVINSGVVIGSTSNSTTALTISSFASGDTVSVTNNGYIVGAGGRGGDSNSNKDQEIIHLLLVDQVKTPGLFTKRVVQVVVAQAAQLELLAPGSLMVAIGQVMQVLDH